MATSTAIILALGLALVTTMLGSLCQKITPGFRSIAFPGAVLGGAFALLLGPQINPWHEDLIVTPAVYENLGYFPGWFINVVFACLMLGQPIRSLKNLWVRARPMIVMGHIYAWGQYVVGIALTLLILGPWLGINDLAGVTIAIGFQGGHGTAAGLTESFNKLEFSDGRTMAYAIATFGIVAGTVLGPVLAHAVRKRIEADFHDGQHENPSAGEPEDQAETDEDDDSPLTGKLTIHLALLSLIIAFAWSLLQGLATLESTLRPGAPETIYSQYIPLFSVVMLCGLFGQIILQKLGLEHVLDRKLINLISALALDLVIVGALATLNLTTLGDHWLAILLLCLAGLVWNLSVFFFLGPKIYPDPWYAYGLGDLGGGTATTASGLMLIRVVDPANTTQARAAYSSKQPFYEPLMGGGLVTAFALPLLAGLGPVSLLLITGTVLAAAMTYALLRVRQAPRS